jgi:hypothetical protein
VDVGDRVSGFGFLRVRAVVNDTGKVFDPLKVNTPVDEPALFTLHGSVPLALELRERNVFRQRNDGVNVRARLAGKRARVEIVNGNDGDKFFWIDGATASSLEKAAAQDSEDTFGSVNRFVLGQALDRTNTGNVQQRSVLQRFLCSCPADVLNVAVVNVGNLPRRHGGFNSVDDTDVPNKRLAGWQAYSVVVSLPSSRQLEREGEPNELVVWRLGLHGSTQTTF